MLSPLVVVVVAAACAVTAFAIPTDPWAEDIYVDTSPLGESSEPTELTVRIDDDHLVVHAPDGFTVDGWGSSSDRDVSIRLRQLSGPSTIGVVFGRGSPSPGAQIGERDGRPIVELARGGGVMWQVQRGAVVIVRSPAEPLDVLVDVLEAIEIS